MTQSVTVKYCAGGAELQAALSAGGGGGGAPQVQVLVVNDIRAVWAQEAVAGEALRVAQEERAAAEVAAAEAAEDNEEAPVEPLPVEGEEGYVEVEVVELPPLEPVVYLDEVLHGSTNIMVRDSVAEMTDEKLALTNIVPSTGLYLPGPNLHNEVQWCRKVLEDPVRPVLAVVGGGDL